MSTVVAINRRETLERLKQNYHIKSFVKRKEANVPAKLGYRPGPKMCIERMRWLTRSYQETEGQPEVLRRAKALEKILQTEKLTVDQRRAAKSELARKTGILARGYRRRGKTRQAQRYAKLAKWALSENPDAAYPSKLS